jgi:hypothetical protein
MAEITKEELATRVLRYLVVIAANEDPDDDDLALVEDEIDNAIGRLTKYGKAPFDVEAIPDEAKQQMRDYVAFYVCGDFGVPADRKAELQAGAKRAEFDLNVNTACAVAMTRRG